MLEGVFAFFISGMIVAFGCLFWVADVPFNEVAHGFLVPQLQAAALPTVSAQPPLVPAHCRSVVSPVELELPVELHDKALAPATQPVAHLLHKSTTQPLSIIMSSSVVCQLGTLVCMTQLQENQPQAARAERDRWDT